MDGRTWVADNPLEVQVVEPQDLRHSVDEGFQPHNE